MLRYQLEGVVRSKSEVWVHNWTFFWVEILIVLDVPELRLTAF
jgi:hypothetical protein